MAKKTCAIITGGSNGLGKALLEKFKGDFDKVLNYDLEEGLNTVYADDEKLRRIVGDDYEIKLLINNASVEQIDWIEDVKRFDADKIVSTNVLGYFYMTQACVKHSMKDCGGTVINICSVAATVPMRASTLYNATKAAQMMMTRQLGRELSRHNILVFGFNPGKIADTPMTSRLEPKIMQVRGWTKEHADKYQYAYIPVGRYTNPAELSKFIHDMYSARTDYLQGSVINFTGGQ
jgi:NAD(P)-dependent dehydrogenase (short-subunit alcohol dehydrogenase family)